MRPEVQVVLSGCLTFGVPLLFAAREVMVLRRQGRGDDRPNEPPEPQPQQPKPLPPCLLAPFQHYVPPADTPARRHELA